MSKRPDIKEGDWIKVGSCNCVVSIVRDLDHPFGDCEVVLNPKKPANVDVKWNETEWAFVDPDDFGGYAEKYSRLNKFISILKNGKSSLLFFILLSIVPISSFAAYVDGYRLQKASQSYDSSAHDFDDAYYLGYVVGMVDSFNGILFNLPDGVTAGQLAAIVSKYLKDHPEEWNIEGRIVIHNAILSAFPESSLSKKNKKKTR